RRDHGMPAAQRCRLIGHRHTQGRPAWAVKVRPPAPATTMTARLAGQPPAAWSCMVRSGAAWSFGSRAVFSVAGICSGHLFGPVPDPAEHLVGHDEADRLDGLDEK